MDVHLVENAAVDVPDALTGRDRLAVRERNGTHVADLAGPDDLLGFDEGRLEAQLEAETEHLSARGLIGGDHLPRIVEVLGHRLFEEDVLPCREGREEHRLVKAGRSGDEHHIDGFSGERLLDRGIGFRPAFRCRLSGPRLVRVAYGDDFGEVLENGGITLADATAADDRDLHDGSYFFARSMQPRMNLSSLGRPISGSGKRCGCQRFSYSTVMAPS